MDFKKFLDYMIWADDKIFAIVPENERSGLEEKFGENVVSIGCKLLHLTEEYRAWLCDIKKLDFRSYIQTYQSMSNEELIQEIRALHKEWSEYLDKQEKESSYEIDEGKFTVKIYLDEVIYNLVNHSTYHRGQIVLLLRLLDIKVPITDYYWYKINQL